MHEIKNSELWKKIAFISDIHLSRDGLKTFAVWRDFLDNVNADALFILGDLFEVWLGDDVLAVDDFVRDCVDVLYRTAKRQPTFIMHGNRDFLLGKVFYQHTNCIALQDPTVLTFATERLLLIHGDSLCYGDTHYMKFRKMVRHPDWQKSILAKPLKERQRFAQSLRQESQVYHQDNPTFIDLDHDAMLEVLQQAHSKILIHGHTHKPGDEQLDAYHKRMVLSDWDGTGPKPRAEVLYFESNGDSYRYDLVP